MFGAQLSEDPTAKKRAYIETQNIIIAGFFSHLVCCSLEKKIKKENNKLGEIYRRKGFEGKKRY